MLAVVEQPVGNANKYDPSYCQVIRDLAQQGKFPETWCAEIGVTYQTFYNWANTYPEFEEAMHIAWYLLRSHWAEKAAMAATIGSGSALPTVLLEILRKRFPEVWGNNPQVTHEHFARRNEPPAPEAGGAPLDGGAEDYDAMSDEELDARIELLQKRREAEEGI